MEKSSEKEAMLICWNTEESTRKKKPRDINDRIPSLPPARLRPRGIPPRRAVRRDGACQAGGSQGPCAGRPAGPGAGPEGRGEDTVRSSPPNCCRRDAVPGGDIRRRSIHILHCVPKQERKN